MSGAQDDLKTSVCVGPYILGKTVGKGQYGKVKRAFDVRTKQEVAVKAIKRAKVSPKDQVMLDREVRIHQLLRHPNIVNVLDAIEIPGKMLYVICEYCPRGEIFDYLLAHGRLKESDARRFFRELVAAVDYCHSFGFVHRDLKLENILLDAGLHVKLTDFGFSRTFDMDHYLSTSCGSPLYASPEVLNGNEYRGPEVDVWSLGVVLYALVVGAMPYMYETPAALRSAVNAGVRFAPSEHLSPTCAALVDRLLALDGSKRITMADLRCHPWICEDGLSPIPASRPPCAVVTPEDVDEDIVAGLRKLGFKEEDIDRQLFDRHDNAIRAVYQLILSRSQGKDKRSILEPTVAGPDGKSLPEANSALPASPTVKRPRRNTLQAGTAAAVRKELALDPAVIEKLNGRPGPTTPTPTTPTTISATTPTTTTASNALPPTPTTPTTLSNEVASNATTGLAITPIPALPPHHDQPGSPGGRKNTQVTSLPSRIRQRRSSEDSDSNNSGLGSPPKPRAPLDSDFESSREFEPYEPPAPRPERSAQPPMLGELGRRATIGAGGTSLLTIVEEPSAVTTRPRPSTLGRDREHSPDAQPDSGGSSARSPKSGRSPPFSGDEGPVGIAAAVRNASLRLAARRTSSPEARSMLKEAARRASMSRGDKPPVEITPIPSLAAPRAGRRHSTELLPALAPTFDATAAVVSGNLSAAASTGPRPVRVAFSAQTTSAKPPAYLLRNVKEVLRRKGVTIDEVDEDTPGHSEYLLNCHYKTVEFEVEVCQIPRLSLHCLRFARKSGDVWLYKDIHNHVVPALDL